MSPAHFARCNGLGASADEVGSRSGVRLRLAVLGLIDEPTGMSTCSVAASYKPPMLVTRVRLPACAVCLVVY